MTVEENVQFKLNQCRNCSYLDKQTFSCSNLKLPIVDVITVGFSCPVGNFEAGMPNGHDQETIDLINAMQSEVND